VQMPENAVFNDIVSCQTANDYLGVFINVSSEENTFNSYSVFASLPHEYYFSVGGTMQEVMPLMGYTKPERHKEIIIFI